MGKKSRRQHIKMLAAVFCFGSGSQALRSGLDALPFDFVLPGQALVLQLEALHHAQHILRQRTLRIQFQGAACAVECVVELEGARLDQRQIGQRDHIGTIGLMRFL